MWVTLVTSTTHIASFMKIVIAFLQRFTFLVDKQPPYIHPDRQNDNKNVSGSSSIASSPQKIQMLFSASLHVSGLGNKHIKLIPLGIHNTSKIMMCWHFCPITTRQQKLHCQFQIIQTRENEVRI